MAIIKFELGSDISTFECLNDNLIFLSTKQNSVQLLSALDFTTLQNITHQHIDQDAKLFTTSIDAKLLAFANNKKVYILSTQNLKILNSVEIGEDILGISFNNSSTYIFVTLSNGEILQYRYNARTLLSRYCTYSKINHLSINSTKLLSVGKNISLFDTFTHQKSNIVIDSKSSISYGLFLDQDSICLGDNSGYLYFFSLKNHKITKKISTQFKKITQILKMQNSRYIMVAGDDDFTILIDTKVQKIISYKYLQFEKKILSIQKFEINKLIVLFDNNIAKIVELSNPTELQFLIYENKIEEAYKFVEKNVMLEDTLEHKMLEQIYKSAYREATLSLINKNRFLARKMLENFLNIKSKKDEIDKLFKAYENYEYLKELYHDKKISLCYALIDKYPPLKMTSQYKRLEERYKQALLNAQFYISSKKLEEAKEVLQDYLIINSKRNVVKMLLNSNRLKGVNSIDNFNILNKTISKLDISMLKLHKAYSSGNFKLCYEILDSNKNLHDLELSTILTKHYNNMIYRCDEYALKGDIQNLKKELGDFIHISTRRDKIGSLLRVAFHVKIKQLISYKTIKQAENMIYSYLDIFGIDSEIVVIMKKYELFTNSKLAISEEQNTQKFKDFWYFSGYFT
ncbi:MAG: hypothetical protein JXQ66_03105 [Campylobacterales bacterium]|nr:hypothetical protein [Campylobacterales bacterium]